MLKDFSFFLIELNIIVVVNRNCQLLNTNNLKCTSMTNVVFTVSSGNLQTEAFYNVN